MKIYLRFINPVIALVVLLLCLWAAVAANDGQVMFSNLIHGGLPTYFFAKGLFCSSALFIGGKILEVVLQLLKKE